LVDKDGTPRIGGLGNAFILSNPEAGIVGGRIDLRLYSCILPPEFLLAGGEEYDPTHRTKASDMYAFGIMIFEVRADIFVWYLSAHSLESGSHRAAAISWVRGTVVNDAGGSASTV